jgi:hypothetical protein
MESRPVIADGQSLERLEDEEQNEEEDLDDDVIVVDELDDELDILGEEDLADDDDEESPEVEEDEVGVEEDEDEDVVDVSDSTSLEELLAQRTAARQVSDDLDEDEDEDFISLTSDETRKKSPPKSKVTPLRNREEFVCKRCFLLKPKVQLADSERMLCRDCV